MSDLNAALKRLRILVLDVDGTLTDGFVYYGLADGPVKRFYIRDGQGISNIQKAGVRVAFVTGDVSEATRLRARRLKVEDIHEGIDDKGPVVRALLEQYGIAHDEAAYMGDEPSDIAGMDAVCLAIAPADAVAEVRDRADVVTEAIGGFGAVREVCDAIMKAKAGEQ